MAAYGINTSVPLTEAVAVALDVTFEPSIIYVGSAGALTVRPSESRADVTYIGVAGGVLPVLVTAVRSAGLVAGGLVRSY